MTDLKQTNEKGEIIQFNPEFLPNCQSNYFSPEFWQQRNAIIGSATGRGTTYFIQTQHHQLVLRHYRRGGMIGKLLSDQYLYLGIESTRAVKEFNLLDKMNNMGLPAPTPVAYRVRKTGIYYQADLISLKIENAKDVHHILQTRPLTESEWTEIGKTIGLFHQHQIYHHDLNIHNIMLDDMGKVWLIDFDKCAEQSGNAWKQQNLDRLLRSLKKEKNKIVNFHFEQQDWSFLINSYQAD
ncbi:3-deoxy-D-manno-octulosonic acid kinase [Aliiglaciecola sp. 3_MG-2023]|uniref:3-deoxy-D-manno-octulosonic acid kinase n=1 Tax=Aliiglaciecola sp. 3_MG-2023 TaxID=3062644 RepID=UPI0026E267CE|nr:3-deoxy-D-manno-octulosonic acid kinase [Aliiglaciecola sp. 3_MG-2023]MDO6693012.1 3-deoxy-D-manno-octulosonic acid kinase [Aliiglaciecola sp. 3_MG-2023]